MAGLTSLWMGDIHPYMDENFIMDAFRNMGEMILGVRIMRNKYTGQPLGYCFVHFPDEKSATVALNMCNGKVIPNSNPVIRFKLNHASGKGVGPSSGSAGADKEFVLWVGDLTSDVDDQVLYKAFAARYNSIKLAKVIKDDGSVSRGYGFVRFSNEDEHKDSLANMQGFKGIGSRPIKVGLGMLKGDAKSKTASAATPTTTANNTNSSYLTQGWDYSQYPEYSGYYDGSYSGYTGQEYSNAAQQDTAAQYEEYTKLASAGEGKEYEEQKEWADYSAAYSYAGYYYDPYAAYQNYGGGLAETTTPSVLDDEHDDSHVVDYNTPLDVEGMNKELMERSREFWDALDASRWLPFEGLLSPILSIKQSPPHVSMSAS